jgi:membrane protein
LLRGRNSPKPAARRLLICRRVIRLKEFANKAAGTFRRWRKALPPPFDIILEAINGWSRDDVPRLGASLAYYTLFSLAPIMLIAVTIAGVFFGPEVVRGQLVSEMQKLIGPEGAKAVQSLLEGAVFHGGKALSVIIGAITFLLASTGAFLELQHALNTVFKVKTDTDARVVRLLIRRLKSFGLVVSLGFLLLVSLAVSAGISAFSTWAHAGEVTVLWQGADILLSLGIITLLFAAIYWFLPDVRLHWRDVWTGAFVTAALFTTGKSLIGLYLGRTTIASSYGAIGSILILLIWVYYSSQLILLGAEITRVSAERRGHHPPPDDFGKQDRKARPSLHGTR